ncbi:MAG: UvrD-helicase domain-containing protein, partial [Bacteroidetes bacterium]|nr:UvrD-helicase domain-containing protein [Bacteroidota bacterium]
MTLLTEFQSKALEYKKHISLTANAGSGKTFVLSKRYLKIVTEENIPLRNIAAITFTDKASSELYNKIAKHIDEKISESSSKNEINKLENIRRQLVSANISTIHSFCIDILRDHPVEAELDANFSAIDEQTSDELIELSIDEIIRSSVKDPVDSENLKYMIRLFASKNVFAEEMKSLIKDRKNVLDVEKNIYSKSELEIAEYFHNTFVEYYKEIIGKQESPFINSLIKINNSVLEFKPKNEIAAAVNSQIDLLKNELDTEAKIKVHMAIKEKIIKSDGFIRLQNYLVSDLREMLVKEIETVENFYKDFNYLPELNNSKLIEYELARFGKIAIHYFNKMLETYTKKKAESGFLDYEDILLNTKKVLDIENVRKDIAEKYKYIMIDEYQDTNELQYNIFLPILDHLKKGNLFVVGDEKQSIYMFRDAELEVFNRTKNEIEDASGAESLLTLPDSFRMAPKICLLTNILFKNLFAQPNLLFNEVNHSDLVCARDDDNEGNIEFLIHIKDETATENNEQSLYPEAELVANRILKLIQSDKEYSWNDIAILCRRRKSFSELEKVFVKYNIPFLIIGGKGFYQRQSIYDIYNYFSFLADENNDTALVGILRSPFFSLSDAAIFEISTIQRKNLWEKLKDYSANNESVKNIVKTINENLTLSKNFNIPHLLRKILNESNFISVIAAKSNGVQELANIEKLMKLTLNFFSLGYKTLYDYINYLKDSIEQTDDESQAVVSQESNSVKIMTLHQAKGLEFPAVFLYKCDETSIKGSVKSKSILVNKKFGILTKVPVNNQYSSNYEAAPVIGINNLITHKKELAEIKRLLYVGITRAKNYLFISASVKKDNEYGSDTFIGLFQKGLGLNFNTDSIELNSELKFLRLQNNNYEYYSKDLSAVIPIIKTIENPITFNYVPDEVITKKQLRTENIQDVPSSEIVSATKLSVFKQCPLKYQLTYDLGFVPLYSQYKNWEKERKNNFNYEFNEHEDESLSSEQDTALDKGQRNYSNIKGRIVHKILQTEINYDEVDNHLTEMILSELGSDEDKTVIKNLEAEVKENLLIFYNSKEYEELSKFKNYKNEFEIYLKENDYFLYGIIDKLIIENDTAIIVDYKTDTIEEKVIQGKIENYINQLSFYSYIVSKLFQKINKIELRLIFIKYPNKMFVREIENKDLSEIKAEIEKMIN